MSVEIKVPRKLIEVALPLDAINQESLRRKQKAPKGWPTSFHKWWAQRPIAAARAVLFAQLVNDPGFQHGDGFKYGKNKKEAAAERKRLFRLMEELVKWDNSDDEELLQEARREIWKSWREVCDLNQDHPSAAELFDPDKFPVIYDPFAGSGTIPLEAQWLGLSTIASDLNPVAVLLNRAMIEFPFRFANRRPASVAKSGTMNFDSEHNEWKNSRGLAEDVRNYSAWMRKEAERRIGNLYPPIEVTAQMAKDRPDLKSLVGESLPVTAWIWARTVKSPNPKFSHIDVPLVSNYVLSNKGANAFVEPEVKADSYYFRVKVGTPPANASKGTKLARGANFACLMSGMPIDADYIKAEGIAGRMGCRLMAIVAQSGRGRVYLSPTAEQEEVAFSASPQWQPDISISGSTQYLGIKPYGIETFSQLFTKRQLVALTTLCDLVSEAAQRCRKDALDAGLPDDGKSLDDGGVQVTAYAEALAVYLAIIVDRVAFYGSMLCGWLPKDNAMGKTMPQQALAMSWDFAEGNPLGKSSTDVTTCSNSISSFLEIATPNASVVVDQRDAQSEIASASKYIFSTDPPYYDNVPYADLSDFFYVWLRKSLRPILPKLFATVTTPKENELVAFAHRHKEGKLGAADFFLNGMSDTMRHLVKSTHPAFPATIYYAFKETENDSTSGSSRAGWETFLESVVKAGFAIDGTWPLRTEGEKRMRASGSNALASSIVLVCRKRSSDALTASRREFIRELNSVLPIALEEMTQGGDHSAVAPVDLAQAIIGPGMAIFSKYSAVLEADGSPMKVKTALQLINRFLSEADFDPDTQFCLHWFESNKWDAGKFGDADVLARAKGTGVDALKEGGVLKSSAGTVRLYKWEELPADWNPEKDKRLSVWEILHHLIRKTNTEGEKCGGVLLAKVHNYGEAIRTLAYRLYTICERRGWASDASAYNNLVLAWESLDRAAQEIGYTGTQISLFGDDVSKFESKKGRKAK